MKRSLRVVSRVVSACAARRLGNVGVATGRRTNFTLADLPYLKTGLAPAISPKALDLHFNKHHKTYLKNTNDLIKGTPLEGSSLEDVIVDANTNINTPLFNNSAQLWNHSFFWDCMASETGSPSDALKAAINTSFGDLDTFKDKFTKSAIGNFGSGWTWLVKDPTNGKLEIVNTSNAKTPITTTLKPLLTIDVWEHSYYVDHENRRPEYIGKWWDVVNWNFVSERFNA